MDRFALKFSETKKREGVELGETRIGVNTGSVIIGNVGSKTQFDYRALGDAVNSAARLENVNKYLGTRVCISGFTVSKCPDFIGRPIGSLVLQGKSKAVDTYEPLNKTEYHSDWISAYHAAYNLLEKEDSGAYKAFNLLAENYPQDRLATFHAKRLKFGMSGKHIVFNKK